MYHFYIQKLSHTVNIYDIVYTFKGGHQCLLFQEWPYTGRTKEKDFLYEVAFSWFHVFH